MRILVTGGTGTVGSQLVPRLLERGADVRVLTRDPGTVAERFPGTEAARGSLDDPATLPAAFEGATAVFLLTPLHPREVELGVAGVEAARAAGVERLVLLSVQHAREASRIPHFGSKVRIAEALERSGVPHTVLHPNSFFQNDVWFREAIMRYGVYPAPFGTVGVSRVDVRDVADAAARALTEAGHIGESYPVVGPEALTGEGTAAVWSRVLGRDVRYGGDDLDAWEAQAREAMPAWMVADVRVMLEHFLDRGLVATDDEVARTTGLLGRPPRAYEAFAAEMARAWAG